MIRQKAKTEHEKRLAVMKELEEARQRQFKDKEMRIAENAKQERDEFLSIINKQRAEEEAERREAEQKKNAL